MERNAQWAETGVGAVVLAVAAAFLIYALSHAGAHLGGGYTVTARFGQVGSLASGADVRVAGVKVGSVERIELDPKTYLARTSLRLNAGLKLPADSSARITSDSLLGGQHVAIEPGGSLQDLKPGGEIQNAQGAVDLFGLIGQFIRGSGTRASSTTGVKLGGSSAPAAPSGPPADPYPGGDQ